MLHVFRYSVQFNKDTFLDKQFIQDYSIRRINTGYQVRVIIFQLFQGRQIPGKKEYSRQYGDQSYKNNQQASANDLAKVDGRGRLIHGKIYT
jgi:hypothetical protein